MVRNGDFDHVAVIGAVFNTAMQSEPHRGGLASTLCAEKKSSESSNVHATTGCSHL